VSIVDTMDSPQIGEHHEVRIEPLHLRCQGSAPVARHRQVLEDPRHAKSEPAHSRNLLIAEPVHIKRVEVGSRVTTRAAWTQDLSALTAGLVSRRDHLLS
jgi:hypothetical protein